MNMGRSKLIRNRFLILILIVFLLPLQAAAENAAADQVTDTEMKIMGMLESMLCNTMIIDRMKPILQLERQLKSARLTYGDYKRIHDQLDFYWTDIRPLFRSQLDKSGVQFTEFQSLVKKQERYWHLGGEVSEKVQSICPKKYYDSLNDGGVVSILISMGDRFLRVEVP